MYYQTDTWQLNTKINQKYTNVRPYARLGANFNTDLSLDKPLLKKRLILTLDVSDLLGTGDQYRTFYSGPQRTMLYDTYSTSTVSEEKFTVRKFNKK